MVNYGLKLYGIVLFFGTLLLMWLWKKYKNHCNSFENQILTDDDETLPNINYNVHNENDIHYLFWTGGYDSTFRLCQLLLVEDKPVRPIYLMCGDVDDSDNWLAMISRKNVSTEIKTMKDIRTELLKNNSHLANKFLPTFYVVSIKKNLETTAKFKRLHRNLHYFSRNISQYERMARFSKEFSFPIEVGLENCGTGLDEATKGNRVGKGSSCQLIANLPLRYQDLDIFRNFRFPICHLTKEEMKDISLRYNFYYLLVMTFSCWYPDKDGNACKKCQMCKKRII